MSTISHKSTAKASLRNLLATHGKSGTLDLLAEVLREGLPSRKGRPTRDESVTRLIVGSLASIIPEVLVGEEIVAGAMEKLEEVGEE